MEHGITPISGNLTPRGAQARPRPVAVPDLPAEPPASLGQEVIREIPAHSLLDSLSGGGLLIDERG